MPKITWLSKYRKEPPPPPPVKQDYVGQMITAYMRQRKITYAMLGERLGKPGNSLKEKKHNGGERYKLCDLFAWCDALGVEETALADAVARMYREARTGT